MYHYWQVIFIMAIQVHWINCWSLDVKYPKESGTIDANGLRDTKRERLNLIFPGERNKKE